MGIPIHSKVVVGMTKSIHTIILKSVGMTFWVVGKPQGMWRVA